MIKKLVGLAIIATLSLSLLACGGKKEVEDLNTYLAGKTFLIEKRSENNIDDGKQYNAIEELLTFNEDGTADKFQYIASIVDTSERYDFYERTYTNEYGLYAAAVEKGGELVINLYNNANNTDTPHWQMDVTINEDGTYTLRAFDRDGVMQEVSATTELPTQDYKAILSEEAGRGNSVTGSSNKGNSGSGNIGAGGYDMPNEGESFSDYVQRVDPELYDAIMDRYDELTD